MGLCGGVCQYTVHFAHVVAYSTFILHYALLLSHLAKGEVWLLSWWWCGAVARGEGSSGLRSTLTTQPYYYYLDFCVDSVVFVCGTGSRSGLVALVW